MKITSLKLRNFRSYKEETVIDFNDLTVLVGKNDIGKSTILEALDIFFNDGKGVISIDRGDVNVDCAKEGHLTTRIAVTFDELPKNIVIDSTVSTTLADEYLLNADSQLEVVKEYKEGDKATTYIRALHPSNLLCNDLLTKKNSDLKKIIKSDGIDCDNLTVNSIMRHAIWNHYSSELKLEEADIPVGKEDAKVIWDKLKVYLPVYTLFQSDRQNSDSDSEVQDPLKEAVKEILSDPSIQSALTGVADIVEEKLKEVADRTLEKLREMDPDVANSLNPVIPTSDKLKWSDVFKSVSISGDEGIPINKRGSGVRRLVLLNFFRAEAERRATEEDNTGIIYAIEEPETSQHPDNQRLLIHSFIKLAGADNTQVIMTTHSPVIVKELDYSNLRVIVNKDGKKKVVNVEPSVLKYPSLNEVNFIAYDEATEEYHDELFGYIDFHKWWNEYKSGKPERDYLKANNKNDKVQTCRICLTEYIRHQIHHPENKHNPHYTHEELIESINDMRNFIQAKNIIGDIVEP